MTIGFLTWEDEAQVLLSAPVNDAETGKKLYLKRREIVPASRIVGIATIYEGFRLQGFESTNGMLSKGVIERKFAAFVEAFVIATRYRSTPLPSRKAE
jgi:hypothetical protein